MGWFEDLTGFSESPESVRQHLSMEGDSLISQVNGRRAKVGQFELVSLATLRQRTEQLPTQFGSLRFGAVTGEARELHRRRELSGALFQVASQFNCLEMTGPEVTPEDGVSRYEFDHTQGPACAIAAGAATIYRNYFVPVGGQIGQSEACQLDGLLEIGKLLKGRLCFAHRPWQMLNGYALPLADELELIKAYIENAGDEELDELRAALSIGIQWNAEVTDGGEGATVSQAFCSALPVAYSHLPGRLWEPFARLILEATYEAALLAGTLNASANSRTVLLTLVGGGAFGNAENWILDAIERSLKIAKDFDLDVRLVSYGGHSDASLRLLRKFE